MWVRSLGQEDPLEEGTATQVQYSCLENPRDGEACTVHGVAQSRTRLKRLSMHALGENQMTETGLWGFSGSPVVGTTRAHSLGPEFHTCSGS